MIVCCSTITRFGSSSERSKLRASLVIELRAFIRAPNVTGKHEGAKLEMECLQIFPTYKGCKCKLESQVCLPLLGLIFWCSAEALHSVANNVILLAPELFFLL